MKQTLTLALAAGLLALLPPSTSAQAARTFAGRLAPMPLDLAMAATMAGQGSATATLTASTLAVNGTFEGLKSPATVARLHKSAKPGMRGEPVLDLQVTKSVTGTVTATVNLTPQQVTDLQNGRLYIQIHSEKAPDGNLWGWLLPQETKR